jgi:hypothetical protein
MSGGVIIIIFRNLCGQGVFSREIISYKLKKMFLDQNKILILH